ncbi:UBX domain-containing protein 7-like isoform X2 [Ostrea edulis]|uniref:UBX domain-containing protein 7-like isoform X2 n=1 Tax=Ostrea edulis TaxID=37623 RepID=UPI0024AF49E6|nr:UBX domain-containing protein 7-like isoform X2 [Ostrea edulis]
MSSMSEKIEQFCSITGADEEVGKNLLEACNGNLELAIDMHMDSEGPPASVDQGGASAERNSPATRGASSSAPIDLEDDIRAPIPQRNETLVEDLPAFVSAPHMEEMLHPQDSVLRGRRRQARSVFDGFRDFQAEARQQEEMMRRGSSSSYKKRTLEDLFRPPIDITYKGTFAGAREAGTELNKYIMVNVQDVKEFVCQALNRDVWSHEGVKAIVKDHFVFWQVYHDSEEGGKFKQFYKVEEYPYIAIIDPRTGENMVTWSSGLDAVTFCDLVTHFLAEHPFSDDSLSEQQPSKRAKQEPSVVDLSEDDQIQAAIKASLQEPRKSVTYISDSEDNHEDDDDIETFSDTEEDSQSSPVKKNVSKNCSQNKVCSDSDEISSSSKVKNSVNNDECKECELNNIENGDSKSDSNCSDDSYKNYLGKESDPQTSIMIRFPDGKRQQLSMSSNSKLMALVKYVAEQGYPNERYELLTNFPRKKLSYMDFDITIQEAGLNPQESVFVQAR